jgi:hypothetical protein
MADGSAPTELAGIVFTREYVQNKLAAEMESDEPDTVLAVLKAHDGKPITKRLLAKLPGGEERWRLRQTAGMTNLEDRDYLHSQGNRGLSFLMAYALTSVRIDAAWVEKHNPAYFDGRRERNRMRTAAIGSPEACRHFADTLTAYARAKAKLDQAAADLERLTGFGSPFSPDQYDWERVCGAREERK